MTVRPLTDKGVPQPLAPYAPAVWGNAQLYVSGQIALDASTSSLVGDSSPAQLRQALKNVARILEAAGKEPSDVMRVTLYLTDMDSFAEVNEAYQQFFAPPFPARTTVGVASLPLGALVELDLIVG